MLSSVFIIGSVVYSYPLVLGRIFRPNSTNGFYIHFPQYVFDVRDYLVKKPIQGRVLSYPDDSIERFGWHYSGTDSILNLLSNTEVIFSPLNETNSPVANITSEIYSSLKRNEVTKANRLSQQLNITNIFVKSDQESLSPNLSQLILNNKNFGFGDWNFYKIDGNSDSKIGIGNCCTLTYPYSDYSKNLSVSNKNKVLVDPNDSLLKNVSFVNNDVIIHAENSQEKDFKSLVTTFDLRPHLYARNVDTVQYDFTVSQTGNYSPILEKYNLDALNISDGKIQVIFDGKNTTLSLSDSDDSYLYFSPIQLFSGKHTFVINLRNKNLINSSSDTLVNTTNKDRGEIFGLKDFDPYSYYLFNVSYRWIYGGNLQILMEQRNNDVLYRNENHVLPNSPESVDYSFYYTPVQSTSKLNVHTIASSTIDELGTKIQLNDISAYKLFLNDLFLKRESKVDNIGAVVTYVRESPSSYSGKIQNINGPIVLLFNENYSKDWELKLNRTPGKVFHFTGNAYANAWYIEGLSGDVDFTILYKPQNFLNVGYILGIVTLIVVLGYFIFDKLVKRNV